MALDAIFSEFFQRFHKAHGIKLCFTHRAEFIFAFARQNAASLRNEAIHPDHVFLAIIQEGFGVGAYVLQQSGVNSIKIQQFITAKLRAQGKARAQCRALSIEFGQMMGLAHQESIAMKHSYIGTEHLVLAYWIENEHVLRTEMDFDVPTSERIRALTKQILGA